MKYIKTLFSSLIFLLVFYSCTSSGEKTKSKSKTGYFYFELAPTETLKTFYFSQTIRLQYSSEDDLKKKQGQYLIKLTDFARNDGANISIYNQLISEERKDENICENERKTKISDLRIQNEVVKETKLNQ